ncbi:hypothetical protein LOK49_LG05G00116 [Camellia lanceoleosa]|uniref:Uncharacterized protein n=1 Tax=Camellia lanceoleosa TaxID=1840588 RepID=A0ACC0HRX4_9ERIC|nr:hypothetical protein LOK49_LG05G00116 [Camellia lanceoleosa]
MIWCSFACSKREVEDFKIIKDGLEKIKREEVLNWKDKEGNTVLHLATSTKQYEHPELSWMSMLSMEIIRPLSTFIPASKRDRRQRNRNYPLLAVAMFFGQIITPTTFTAAMTPPKTFKLKGHPPPINSNNIMIIASILLAMTCFLTEVYPPDGVWQYDYNYKSGFNTTTTTKYKAGTGIMATSTISIFFMFFNLYGLFASLLIICVLIKGSPLRWFFLGTVAVFSTAYLFALALITLDEKLPAILNIFFLHRPCLSSLLPLKLGFIARSIKGHR